MHHIGNGFLTFTKKTRNENQEFFSVDTKTYIREGYLNNHFCKCIHPGEKIKISLFR